MGAVKRRYKYCISEGSIRLSVMAKFAHLSGRPEHQ